MKNRSITLSFRIVIVLVASMAALALASCAKQQAPVAAAAPATSAVLPGGLTPVASVLDLMREPIAPTADFLWGAFSSTSTTKGSEQKQPSTDEEWLVVRQKAVLLAEAANLLTVEGRHVAHPGQKLKDPPGEGDFTPDQAQAEIDKDRAVFVGFAKALQDAAGGMIAAIDKRDTDAYETAGGTLDEVCENCHLRYWYPNAPKPPGA
jgi:hypothetical protein